MASFGQLPNESYPVLGQFIIKMYFIWFAPLDFRTVGAFS
jgi:hypothetical protein